jgi:hypothetical protein
MVITIDRTNFCLLRDTPKQSEEGKLPVLSYQFSPETLLKYTHFKNPVGLTYNLWELVLCDTQ